MQFMTLQMDLVKIDLHYNGKYHDQYKYADIDVSASYVQLFIEWMSSTNGRKKLLMPPMIASFKFWWKEDSQTVLRKWWIF